MPEYGFRLRFHLTGDERLKSDAGELELLTTSEGARIYLKSGVSGKPFKESERAAVLGAPYPTYADAGAAGTRARRALLLWAVEYKFGIDLGNGPQKSGLTKAGVAWLTQQWGHPVRNDFHGLDVYELQKGLLFASSNLQFSVGRNPEHLISIFQREFPHDRVLSEKQLLSAEIYCSSFFDAMPRSRFLTLVTAIEALLEPELRSDAANLLVNEFERLTNSRKELVSGERESIVGALQRLKNDSISQAGQKLTRKLLPTKQYLNRSSSDFFRYAYNVRSDIMHTGAPREAGLDILSLANGTQEFVNDLLRASIREGQSG